MFADWPRLRESYIAAIDALERHRHSPPLGAPNPVPGSPSTAPPRLPSCPAPPPPLLPVSDFIPGSHGIYQVNLQVPAGVPDGDQLVTLEIADRRATGQVRIYR